MRIKQSMKKKLRGINFTINLILKQKEKIHIQLIEIIIGMNYLILEKINIII